MDFKIKSDYKPTGDQPQAIEKLVAGIDHGVNDQVLLGVTGSGKTFTMANVIEKTQKPTLIISHNKTLAAQLYQEFRDYFPENAVSFFVSYYDYYQPESYIPTTDTYIEKETEINELIDKLRLRATTNILTRKDTIVVASVSCIYNIGSPVEYGNFVIELQIGEKINNKELLIMLNKLQYQRSDFGFFRGTYRVRGDILDIYPAYEDNGIRVEFEGEKIKKIQKIDPLTGNLLEEEMPATVIYPAKHYMVNPDKMQEAFKQIEADLEVRLKELHTQGKELEAHRLRQRVNYDLEMMREVGFVNGIENYSRYFDGRKPGDPPYSLLDYYKLEYGNDWLLIIDESHMSIPQIRGMYNGDRSRKQTLVDFGFRLPSALDNRPLRFEEFLRRIPQTIYTSATPAEWEISRAKEAKINDFGGVVEQLIRPTGLVDPEVLVRKTEAQIDDLILEINKRVELGQRTLVTTLTKRMAEDLASYLEDQKIKVHYLHSEVQTLDRSDILDDLRAGKYDVLVGINLLREGLDLPEVSLVAILDADKEGFLRSETSLIQVMGRAARHVSGQVIMYADTITGSMKRAIDEVNRRREIQMKYNQEHGITPETIHKPIREKLIEREEKETGFLFGKKSYQTIFDELKDVDTDQLLPVDRNKLIKRLTREMKIAAEDLNFELAAKLRDRIREIEGNK